jgi:hypothetical protein
VFINISLFDPAAVELDSAISLKQSCESQIVNRNNKSLNLLGLAYYCEIRLWIEPSLQQELKAIGKQQAQQLRDE